MISNEQVLQKILQEAKAALESSDQATEVKAHARSIRLLCDLLLDTKEETVSTTPNASQYPKAVEELELRKMMGDLQSPSATQSKRLDEEEGNGDSLLDF
ncbi:YwdI family protein [Paraliobacillus salinarum]|uniref:YwdI family protein n=1 Tax=Paraliobacillus salinarum TaxID=1158996 RepID=UPI0015F75CEB|nr:YwdI family protein [Paraliobacillus salinarum]